MRAQKTLLLFTLTCLSLSFLLLSGVSGSSHHHHHHHNKRKRHLFNFRPSKLFVFGDSYVDAGNVRKDIASSWKFPYGITFPGKPTGRFSDGRVFSDFMARFIGVKSPIPYRWRKVGAKYVKYGMNFAYGGTGVFNTFTPEPNMTVQIDLFQQMIKDKVYSTKDIQGSVALVSVAGNDYSYYSLTRTNASTQDYISFITSVVNQTAMNLKRLQSMGVKKIAVNALQPLGCLPRSTFTSSFKQCNDTANVLVDFHNLILKQAVADLNNASTTTACNSWNSTTFVMVDVNAAFTTVLKNRKNHQGSTRFLNPLKPCCMGTTSADFCGSVDKATGAKRYTICDDPKSAFFWDDVHPSQAGWRAVYIALRSNLAQINDISY